MVHIVWTRASIKFFWCGLQYRLYSKSVLQFGTWNVTADRQTDMTFISCVLTKGHDLVRLANSWGMAAAVRCLPDTFPSRYLLSLNQGHNKILCSFICDEILWYVFNGSVVSFRISRWISGVYESFAVTRDWSWNYWSFSLYAFLIAHFKTVFLFRILKSCTLYDYLFFVCWSVTTSFKLWLAAKTLERS
jgi:hypothetical protein